MTKTKKQLRAEAVERLKECRYHTLSDYVRAMLGWGHEPHFEDSRDALIDLLTDDDANDDSTPEKVVSGSEPCVTPESCRQYADQRKQVDDADCESCDSREKLEAEASELVAEYAASGDVCDALYHGMLGLLDRQAAITQHEITERWAEHLHPIERKCGDLRRKVEELTAERDKAREESVELYSDLVKASDEREHYREKCSKMATIIHDALMVMDEGMA